jgi:hypothetical protein
MTRENTELAGAVKRLAYLSANSGAILDQCCGTDAALERHAADLRLMLSAAPPPSVEVFGSSSLKGEDTHRAAERAVVAVSLDGRQGEPAGMMTVTLHMSDGSDVPIIRDNGNLINHWARVDAGTQQAAVSTAEQVGTSVASEPNPSVEVERLREALAFYAEDHEFPSDGPWGVNSDDFGNVARAALSKQEPGVPTPGGEG